MGQLKEGLHSIVREYGIVRIKDRDGVIWEYDHLIAFKDMEVGQSIKASGLIGSIECIYPPGGDIRGGLHVHIGRFLEGRDKRLIPIPIDKFQIGGWTIRKDEKPYNGTLIKKGEEIRIADARVCFPQDNNPVPCGLDQEGRIIRNDIQNPFWDFVRD